MSDSVATKNNLESYDEGFFAEHVEGSLMSAQQIIPRVLEMFPEISSTRGMICCADMSEPSTNHSTCAGNVS